MSKPYGADYQADRTGYWGYADANKNCPDTTSSPITHHLFKAQAGAKHPII